MKLAQSLDYLALPMEEQAIAQLFSLLQHRRTMCRHRAETKARSEENEQAAMDYVSRINEQIKELLQLY